MSRFSKRQYIAFVFVVVGFLAAAALGVLIIARVIQIAQAFGWVAAGLAVLLFGFMVNAIKAGHPLRRDRYIAILGTLAGSARPAEELVAQISEADDYLKQFKPFYGLFGVGRDNRRMTAVQLVTALLDESGAGGLPDATVSSVVSTTIEVTIITILLLCAVLAAASAASSS